MDSKGSRQGKGAPRDSAAAGGWSSTPPQKGSSGKGGKGGKDGKDSRSSDGKGKGEARTPRGSAQPRNGKGGGKGKRGTPDRSRQRSDEEGKDEKRPQQDTLIGRGFTAAMKRGVAQAKPTPHEEMVPQKDGGFIATIQRGFEGLFGKPTSKEEVLRRRGPVIAPEYEAVPGDDIDNKVQVLARQLPEDIGSCVKIFRERKGEYQINDERVQMEWKYRQVNGQQESEIFVFWETEDGDQTDPEPLHLYLSHAANVAYEVKEGGFAISQVPEHARLSFDEVGTKITDGSGDARFTAMEVAARQAQMREEAAIQWREKQNNTDTLSRANNGSTPPMSPREDSAPGQRRPGNNEAYSAGAPPGAPGGFMPQEGYGVGAPPGAPGQTGPPMPQRAPGPQAPPAGATGPAGYNAPGLAPAGIMPGQWVATGPTGTSMVVTSMSAGMAPQGSYAGVPVGTVWGSPGGPLQRQATSMYSYGGGYGAAYAVQVR